MITVADIRSYDTRVDIDTAQRVADAWNTVYPHMRAALTAVIDGKRQHLAGNGRRQPSEDTKTAITDSIKKIELVRRELGQLDRGTFKGCTRDPGGFSMIGAFSVVRHALDAFPWDSPHLGDAYRLAAVLADVFGSRATARREAVHKATAG